MRYLLAVVLSLSISACASRLPKNPAVIGMTPEQVKTQTEWGNPWSVNQTITASGVREQWVYRTAAGNQYLYFVNGKLVVVDQPCEAVILTRKTDIAANPHLQPPVQA